MGCRPDGLPYADWDAAGDAGAETLLEVNDILASGYTMPITFSDQLMLFAVKGEKPDVTHEVSRLAADTRPLSFKNTDNKIIVGVNNYLAKRMLAASAVDIQRGFVPGRQLVANVLELDTYARWFGAAGHESFDQCGPSPGVTPHGLFSGSVDPAAIRPRVRVAPEEALKIKKNGWRPRTP